MQRYQNPTEGSWEIFKKPTSAVLFSDYQTFANLPPGLCKINLQNNITCRIPSLQAILILKIRVARTLDQFQGPNVLRNRLFPSFSWFSNFSVAWVRPWAAPISGHRIFWTMRLGRNQDTYFNSVLTEGYQNPTERSWEIFKKPTLAVLFSDYQTSVNLPPGE